LIGLEAKVPELEKGNARQRYAVLLRNEESWITSAKQLLLACKSAMDGETYDSGLVALLTRDYDKLLPHLAFEVDGSALSDQIRATLTGTSTQKSPQLQNLFGAVPVSSSGVFGLRFSSTDLPLQPAPGVPSTTSYDARTVLSSWAANLAHGDKVPSSIASLSSGHSNSMGVTFPDSVAFNMCDSIPTNLLSGVC